MAGLFGWTYHLARAAVESHFASVDAYLTSAEKARRSVERRVKKR